MGGLFDRGFVCKETMESSVYHAMFWVVHDFCFSLCFCCVFVDFGFFCDGYDKCVFVWLFREKQIWFVLVVCMFCIDFSIHCVLLLYWLSLALGINSRPAVCGFLIGRLGCSEVPL